MELEAVEDPKVPAEASHIAELEDIQKLEKVKLTYDECGMAALSKQADAKIRKLKEAQKSKQESTGQAGISQIKRWLDQAHAHLGLCRKVQEAREVAVTSLQKQLDQAQSELEESNVAVQEAEGVVAQAAAEYAAQVRKQEVQAGDPASQI
eukprot:12328131-Alexandrium_andersonii.AAC.1